LRLSAVNLCRSALMAVFIALCSQLIIPLPPVPISLSLFAVYLTGLMLPPRLGLMTVSVYLLMGLCGLPVFAGLQGGPGVLFGPTGGFLIGYLPCVWLTARLKPPAGMGAGFGACCLMGTAWYMLLTRASLQAALWVCILPFLPGDAVKIGLALLLSKRLKKTAGFI